MRVGGGCYGDVGECRGDGNGSPVRGLSGRGAPMLFRTCWMSGLDLRATGQDEAAQKFALKALQGWATAGSTTGDWRGRKAKDREVELRSGGVVEATAAHDRVGVGGSALLAGPVPRFAAPRQLTMKDAMYERKETM